MLIIPCPIQVTEETFQILNDFEVWHFFAHR